MRLRDHGDGPAPSRTYVNATDAAASLRRLDGAEVSVTYCLTVPDGPPVVAGVIVGAMVFPAAPDEGWGPGVFRDLDDPEELCLLFRVGVATVVVSDAACCWAAEGSGLWHFVIGEKGSAGVAIYVQRVEVTR